MNARRIGVLSRGMLAIPHLPALLDAEVVPLTGLRVPRDVEAIAGWGLRPTSLRARRLAGRAGLPYLAVEDGFLRSVRLGNEDPPLSLVLDDLGIYYDASGPSRLEAMACAPEEPGATARARAFAAAWREGRVSKYNAARDVPVADEGFVLVLDQTLGDASVGGGGAGEAAFRRMLEAALDENPGIPVRIKPHPDVLAGRRRGYFDPGRLPRDPRLALLAGDPHPACLLPRAAAVYTATSQAGFEALLWGRRVRCFGMPFYAGWGLTQDDLPAPSRRRPIALERLVDAALLRYPRYISPADGAPCAPERVLEHLALQRRQRGRFPESLHAIGFSAWKRPLVRRFLAGSRVSFLRGGARVPEGATAVVWGMAPAPPGAAAVLRLEDGFLRSVGLGADLVRPLSWVVDPRGMHYDATRPSALEDLLREAAFDAPLLERAARLRRRLVETGLGKYNLPGRPWARPAGARRVVLVAGQVETDAALAGAAGAVRDNRALLAAARAADPGACLVYKPHPDVVAGLRGRGRDGAMADPLADQVVTDVPMAALLDAVDEVHVISSLAGFEALLRGRRVVCHGLPFYAGWGLTEDRMPAPRRGRRLALDELVAGALILYPTYLGPGDSGFATPEEVVEALLAWRARPGAGTGNRLLRPLLRLRGR